MSERTGLPVQDGLSEGRSTRSATPNARERVRLGLLEGFIGFHLRLAQDASFRAFARHVGQRDLEPGRFAAMMVIHNNPGITPGALGRAIARDKSTITPLIQDLRRRGLIERRPSPTDRRSATLSLTKAGESMLCDLLRHAREHDRRLDEIVGDRKPELIRLLRQIAEQVG